MSSRREDCATPAPHEAREVLEGVARDPTIVRIAAAHRRMSELRSALPGVAVRMGAVASFTFEPLRAALELQGLRAGLHFELYNGPFGQYEQELIDSDSGLAKFEPQVVLLAVDLRDACPALYHGFNALSAAAADRLVEEWLARLESALAAFRRRCGAHVLVQNYDRPAHSSLGIADAFTHPSQGATIRRANEGLLAVARRVENVYVIDYDALVARHGRSHWCDPRLRLLARIPIAPASYWHLAGFYVRHVRPLFGLARKVLVLDADNTLWGGVVGDVGLDGIALGHDFPGSAYVAFQQQVLELYHRGVVLCLASRNEPAAVEEVLEKHPDMLLRPRHFAAMRVNWQPKADNVVSMAEELNLGLDSFVFMDDSAVECELIRRALPQVETVALPADPARYADVVAGLDCFDQWALSVEDRQRGELYRAEAGRRRLACAAVDMPTFYRQLEMCLRVWVNHRPHVARASQMTQRTNQFNMNTIRCSEDDVRRMMTDGAHEVVTVALEDRFGDNGVIGLAVLRPGGPEWRLHMLLMSCRVLGRTVEQTFVRWLGRRAQAAGAESLLAEFAPTAKNRPFAGFYESCSFRRDDADGRRWRWRLDAADLAVPDWIRIIVEPAGEAA